MLNIASPTHWSISLRVFCISRFDFGREVIRRKESESFLEEKYPVRFSSSVQRRIRRGLKLQRYSRSDYVAPSPCVKPTTST